MANVAGLGYAAAGVVVAASIVAATAATVGLRAQQAHETPAPTMQQSALATNSAGHRPHDDDRERADYESLEASLHSIFTGSHREHR